MTMTFPKPGIEPGWVLDEDNALKQKLLGNPRFYVTNYASNPDGTTQTIPIQVFFRSPDVEIRTRTFPFVSIDLIDIVSEDDRAHRSAGPIVPFDLETATPPAGFNMVADDFPLPWSLIYQLSCCSRQPTHDRQMTQLMYMMFPHQFGSLDMGNFDGTVRRADLQNVVRRDLPADDANKRIYRQIFTIGVSSQFYLNEINLIQQAISVNTGVVEIGA
jgi:hypothetical protein